MSANQTSANREVVAHVQNGWIMLVLLLGLLLGDVAVVARLGVKGLLLVLCIAAMPVIVLMLTGLFTLQPNEARVLVLFGHYKGTVRESGFHWGNPFYSYGTQSPGELVVVPGSMSKLAGRKPDTTARIRSQLGRNKISLRARTLNVETLKVNDKRGNPIEIGAVVVWRVADTAQAMFDVDNY